MKDRTFDEMLTWIRETVPDAIVSLRASRAGGQAPVLVTVEVDNDDHWFEVIAAGSGRDARAALAAALAAAEARPGGLVERARHAYASHGSEEGGA
jgi:hypothetical protein